jgi:hypothetical protein
MATQYHDDVIHAQPIVTAARSSGGTSVSVNDGPSGDFTFPCNALVLRSGALITVLNVTAWSGQTLTVASSAPAGYTDANVNAGDVLQFPEQVVLATNGTATLLGVNTSYEPLVADTDGSTITFDASVGNRHTVTLAGSRTLAIANVTPGQKIELTLVQDGTGSRTVTWFSGIKWAGGSAPTLTTTASKADIVTLRAITATTFYGTVAQNF